MKTNQVIMLVLALLVVMLVQNAQAFYNPSTGRWLSRDPIGEENFFQSYVQKVSKAELEKWRLASLKPHYNFVHNNPANVVDTEGLFWWPPPIYFPILEDPPDPKKTHLECFYCKRCGSGGVFAEYYACFLRRPNNTPMNPSAFESCMAPLAREAQSACMAWNIPALNSVAKRSKICFDHHW
jgi:hypothetical protein